MDELDSHARRDHKEAWHQAAGQLKCIKGGRHARGGPSSKVGGLQSRGAVGHHKGENHAAGQLKGGRHLQYPRDTPMTNLLMSQLDKAGVRLDDGLGDSTGRLVELAHLADV